MIAQRFVGLFRQRAGVMGLEPPVSMSAGIASMLRDGPESGRQLVDLADRALYRAKAQGKNRLWVRSGDARCPARTAIRCSNPTDDVIGMYRRGS